MASDWTIGNYPSVGHTRGHARVRAAATPLAFRRDAGRPAAVAVADAVQGVPRPRPIQRAEEGSTRNARSPAARFRGGCQKQQRRSESARPGPAPRQGIRPGPRETRERRSAVGQAASSQAPGRSRHGGRGHRRRRRRRRRRADLRGDGRGGRRPDVATRSHDEAPGQPRRHPGAVRAGQRETRGVRGLHHVPEVGGGVPQSQMRPKLFGPSAGTRLRAAKPKERLRQAQEGAAREVNRPARATRRHGRPEGGGADGERALGRRPSRG